MIFQLSLDIAQTQIKTGMSWKIAVGFKFGFLVGSKWKYKGEDPKHKANRQTINRHWRSQHE